MSNRQNVDRQNAEQTKCRTDKMSNRQNVERTKCRTDKMSNRQNVERSKCRTDEMVNENINIYFPDYNFKTF